MNPGRLLVLVAGLLTALRLVLVFMEEPSPAEAYYFLCAQQPAAAYFDGPAGTAFLAGAPAALWRMQAPLWALAATAACYLLIRGVGDAKIAAWTALGLNTLPLFNMAALRLGPLLPALTLSLLGMYLAWRAFGAEKRQVLRWLAAGVVIGAASCVDYAAFALVPALFLFTVCSPNHRRSDDVLGLFIFLLIPALMLVPALAWNASQEWIPIAGGTFRSLWEFDFFGFLRSILQWMGSFSPILLLLMFVVWGVTLRESKNHLRARFVFLVALPGVLLGLYFALRGKESDFLLLLAVPLLLFKLLSSAPVGGWRRMLVGVAFLFAILFSGYGMFNVFQTGQGWRSAAEATKRLFLEKSAQGNEGLFLIAGDPSLASVLGYHLRDELIPPAGHPTVYTGESQDISNQFGLWPSYADFVETIEKPKDEYFTEQHGENPFVGRSALYITHESPNDVPQTIKAAFEVVTFLQMLDSVEGGKEPLYIYHCVNYQTLPL